MSKRRLNGMAAYMAAETTRLRKRSGEKDTEFVKRVVNAYLDAEEQIDVNDAKTAMWKQIEQRRQRG